MRHERFNFEHVVQQGVVRCCVAYTLLGVSRLAAEPALPPEVGYNYGESETPRSSALSGAVRAHGSSTESVFYNPANMVASRIYHLSAIAQIWPEAGRQSYGGAIADSVSSTARLAGGLGFTYSTQDAQGLGREATDVRLSLAYPLSDALSVGMSGRYLGLRQNGTGPLGRSLVSGGLEGQQIVQGITFDAGLTLRLSERMAFAVVGTNLSNPGHGLLPLGVSGGAALNVGIVNMEWDVATDFTTWQKTKLRTMGGLEVVLAESVPLRGGYIYDQGLDRHFISFGVGYLDRQVGIEVAARRMLANPAATSIVFGFTYHLEATGLVPSGAESF